MAPVLTSITPPDGDVVFYSALLYSDVTPYVFFAQKDILNNDAFILYSIGDQVKGHLAGKFPANGAWSDESFKTLLSKVSGISCSSLADSGMSFLFGYAPQGDLTQFHGAWFAFSATP